MNADKKYFGMSVMQVGILAGLAVILLVIVGCGGWLILGNGLNMGPSAPVFTSTPEPTVTPILDTGPTATPTAIISTAVPYEQLIPKDWVQYKTALVEIWLPSNFKLADKKTVDNFTTAIPPELVITEIPSKTSTYNMVVAVGYGLMTGDSLDAYLDNELGEIAQAQNLRVADRRTVYVNSVEARRLVVEGKSGSVDINELVYVFLDGSTVWYVEYVAQINEYFENLPVFEQSIKTFRVVR